MESEKRWSGLGEPWNWLIIALTVLFVLCAMSCKSPRSLSQTHQSSDSLQRTKRFEMSLAPVPMSVAEMKVPSTKLTALPVGAGYSIKSGQATVKVTKGEGDSLIITGTCDSLARQVMTLTEELTRTRSELAEIKEQPPPILTWWQQLWIKIGKLSVSLVVGWFLFRYLRKRFKLPSNTN